MKLIKDNLVIYNGRILNEQELLDYKTRYEGLTESYTGNEVLIKRQAAYKAESDPLYMEWQFDQTAVSEQAWRDKVAEIKLRYPLTDPT